MMKAVINKQYMALAVLAVYRVLALIGVVAILDWIEAPDWAAGAIVMGALWWMWATTRARGLK